MCGIPGNFCSAENFFLLTVNHLIFVIRFTVVEGFEWFATGPRIQALLQRVNLSPNFFWNGYKSSFHLILSNL